MLAAVDISFASHLSGNLLILHLPNDWLKTLEIQFFPVLKKKGYFVSTYIPREEINFHYFFYWSNSKYNNNWGQYF